MIKIPCSIIRGGTSKGVFLLEDYLPQDPSQRDRLLLRMMGSPDPRQIDGLGGADPLTSKVAIVARSDREGIDVEYESVEVGIAEDAVNHGIMCGNLLAGVGAFAIAEGLVAQRMPLTTVRIYCRSNQKTVVAGVPCVVGGEDAGPSPSRQAAATQLVFQAPGGAVTGKLLPVGEPLTTLSLDNGKTLETSIVDAGTLYAFVRAETFGLTGAEEPDALDLDAGFRATIEAAREAIAGHINRQRFHGVPFTSPRLVKMAIVAPAGADREDVDVVARVINRAGAHKAYAVSGAISLAAAAAVPGTLVNGMVRPAGSPFTLRIGHPSGILPLSLHWSADADGTVVHAAEVERSARIIMRGDAYVRTADDAETARFAVGTTTGTRDEAVAP